jgi:hypothetical protein
VGDDIHLTFRQKLLGEDGSERRSVVMVKQPGLFSPKFGATSSHDFAQSPQNFALEPGINSLACWDKFFVLSHRLYRWRHQSEIFWISPRTYREMVQAFPWPVECRRHQCVVSGHSQAVLLFSGAVNPSDKCGKDSRNDSLLSASN